MMDFLGWNIMSGFKAALAKWMFRDIQIADGTPAAVITLVRIGIAAVLIVPAVSLGSMLFAI